jgi:beta-glucosidase
MASLGLTAYRFSIAWPRVQPGGTGPLNRAGVEFYDHLVDKLLTEGMVPLATLYHWDLPQELQDAGGWPARDTADRFAEYAALVHDALADRVKFWATLNEPWCSAWLGYASGIHAPGIQDHAQATRAAHHLMLGHGRAVTALREQNRGTNLGIVLNFGVPHAAAGEEGDADVVDAVRRIDGLQNRMFPSALLDGAYPDDVVADLAEYLTFGADGVVRDGDLAEISVPLDFLGVNYYHDTDYQRADRTPDEVAAGDRAGPYPFTGVVAAADPGPEATDMGWPITPEGFGALLRRLPREWPSCPPLYVTENGVAYDDPVVDGSVDDARRVAFLAAHFRQAADALADGVDLRGYFVWSTLDNFEWAEGYRPRFGIVHVDYGTQERTPKRSAYAYRDMIAAGGDLSAFR